MTLTSGFDTSFRSSMPFGSPQRTTKTIVDV